MWQEVYRRWGQYVFNMFVKTDFWLYLRAQVNKYAVSTRVQNDSGYSNSSMESKWFDAMADELKAFTSLCIIQSRVKKDTLQAYWSTWKSTETSFSPSVISFKLYKLLCKFLHFVENAALDTSNHLAKYPSDYLNKLQSLCTPMQDITIDESLMKLHERHSFSSTLPNKPISA